MNDVDPGAGERRHRILDAWLGGRNNHEVDRQTALLTASLAPWLPVDVQAERAFAHRVVSHLARQGLAQFAVIGCGYPLPPNIHDVAVATTSKARVCYLVDEADAAQDPLLLASALSVAQSRSASDVGSRVSVGCADVYRSQAVLAEVLSQLEPAQPVALLLIGTLARIPDDEVAADLVEGLCAGVAPGSQLAISHFGDAQAVRGDRVRAARTEAALQSTPQLACVLRSPQRIAAFFDEVDLLEPGVAPVDGWRPADRWLPGPRATILGGLARVPGRHRVSGRRR